MRKSRFTESQIVAVLRRAKPGRRDRVRRMGAPEGVVECTAGWWGRSNPGLGFPASGFPAAVLRKLYPFGYSTA